MRTGIDRFPGVWLCIGRSGKDRVKCRARMAPFMEARCLFFEIVKMFVRG